MTEVGFVGAGRVLIVKRNIAVGVRRSEALQLGQRHGLDHREAFGGAIGEIAVSLGQRQAVEEFPGGVAQIEKGRAVRVLEKTAVGGDL
jgi:hypothetical protein